MKKKKLLVVVLLLLVLITSFLLITRKTNPKNKKLKELNYNVTYKQAFPDENLRRGVLLCIMRNKCDGSISISDYYNYSTYEHDAGSLLSKTPTITVDDLKLKEEEQLSKVDLDKIQDLLSLSAKENVTNLEGIEYLINLKRIYLKSVTQENIDLSDFNNLTYLNMNTGEIKNITLPANIFKNIYLSNNKITDITFPTNIKIDYLYLSNNLLTNITLPSDIKIADLEYNKIENVTLRGPIEKLTLEKNNISHIDLVEGIKSLNLNKNKITEINLPSTLKRLDMYDNKLTHIELPNDIRLVDLSSNKIINIDVRNKTNLVNLNLLGNFLEDIDISKNINLEYLKFSLKNSKDTIDFSNNPKLWRVIIYAKEGAKIKSLDFSNNPDLYRLELYGLGLTNLNIENNIEIRELFLENNNLNTIDLSKNKKLSAIFFNNNNSQNIKLPIKHRVEVSEYRKIKVKKNSYITIPRMFYNDKEYFLDENSNYEKVRDKYVFKNIGTHQTGVIVYFSNNGSDNICWYYTFEVEAGEEHTFNPVFDQGNYIPLINEKIPVNNLKKMITNLSANIKNFEIISPNTFPDKGDKTVKVRITFSDDTFKEIDVPIKVYEKEDILPTVTVTPETLELIEKKPVNINITRNYAKENNIDNTNFIKTVRDNLVSYEYLNKANGLTYNSSGIAGVIDYLFTGSEEEHTFNITYKEKGNIYTFNKNISIKLLRDTDKDGTPDKDDDDKDGDGYSNAIEIARGSDPYDKDSLPDMSKKDELDNLVKQLEKLIEDTKNNPFDTKNKLDVDNLKNNYLPGKVTEKDNIKGSYSLTTSDSDLLKLINKVKSEIDDIKKEINKLRDKANFEELDKEINKEVDNSYKELIDKIKEAKDLDRATSTQEEVDKITKEIKELREKIATDKEELKKKIEELEKAISDKLCKSEACKTLLKQAKDLYDKESFTKKEMLDMIEKLDNLLSRKESFINPKTGIKTYSLVIVLLIIISYIVFKKKKSYIR